MRLLSGYLESSSGIDQVIAALNTYGLDGYRASFYVGQGSHYWNPSLIAEFIQKAPNKTIVLDPTHYYPPTGSADWNRVRDFALEACRLFPNAYVEIINEYTGTDLPQRGQSVFDDIRDAGYSNPLVLNKWNHTWSQMAAIQDPDWYCGYHYYFDYWSPSGAKTQADQAAARGLKIINTEVGASTSDNGINNSNTAELNEALRYFESLGQDSAVWQNQRANNISRYLQTGLYWLTEVPQPPPPPPPPVESINAVVVQQGIASAENLQTWLSHGIGAVIVQFGQYNPDGSVTVLLSSQDLDAFRQRCQATGVKMYAWIIKTGSGFSSYTTALSATKTLMQQYSFFNGVATDLEMWPVNNDFSAFQQFLSNLTTEMHSINKTHLAFGVLNWDETFGPNFENINVDYLMPMFYDSFTLDHENWAKVHLKAFFSQNASAKIIAVIPTNTGMTLDFPTHAAWLTDALQEATLTPKGFCLFNVPDLIGYNPSEWSIFDALVSGLPIPTVDCNLSSDCFTKYGAPNAGYHWECIDNVCVQIQDPPEPPTPNPSVAARSFGPLSLHPLVLRQLWKLREKYIRKEVHKKLHPVV